jgi:hypothetical protein
VPRQFTALADGAIPGDCCNPDYHLLAKPKPVFKQQQAQRSLRVIDNPRDSSARI